MSASRVQTLIGMGAYPLPRLLWHPPRMRRTTCVLLYHEKHELFCVVREVGVVSG